MPGSFDVCRRGPSLTGRVRFRGRPVGSVLGADETFHGCDSFLTRDGHDVGIPVMGFLLADVNLPGDSQPVQRMSEDFDDVRRRVGEVVTRILVVALPVPLADAVVRTAAVGVDESSDEHLGVRVDDVLLPWFQHDRSGVLVSLAMLWKNAGPVFGCGLDLDASDAMDQEDPDREDSLDCCPAVGDDLRVLLVVEDRQGMNPTSTFGDVPITEVRTKDIGVSLFVEGSL